MQVHALLAQPVHMMGVVDGRPSTLAVPVSGYGCVPCAPVYAPGVPCLLVAQAEAVHMVSCTVRTAHAHVYQEGRQDTASLTPAQFAR